MILASLWWLPSWRPRSPVAAQIGGQADPPAGRSAARAGPAGHLQELHVLPRHRRLRVQRARPRRLERAASTSKHKDQNGHAVATADRELLLDWLVSKFGPTSRPFPARVRRRRRSRRSSATPRPTTLSAAGLHDLPRRRPRERRALQPRPLARRLARHAAARREARRRRAGTPGRVAGTRQGNEPEPMKRQVRRSVGVMLGQAARAAALRCGCASSRRPARSIFTATSANVGASRAARSRSALHPLVDRRGARRRSSRRCNPRAGSTAVRRPTTRAGRSAPGARSRARRPRRRADAAAAAAAPRRSSPIAALTAAHRPRADGRLHLDDRRDRLLDQVRLPRIAARRRRAHRPRHGSAARRAFARVDWPPAGTEPPTRLRVHAHRNPARRARAPAKGKTSLTTKVVRRQRRPKTRGARELRGARRRSSQQRRSASERCNAAMSIRAPMLGCCCSMRAAGLGRTRRRGRQRGGRRGDEGQPRRRPRAAAAEGRRQRAAGRRHDGAALGRARSTTSTWPTC